MIKEIKTMVEIIDAVTTLYTTKKSITSFLQNKYKDKKFDEDLEKITAIKMDELLKESTENVFWESEEKIANGDYSEIFSANVKDKLVNGVLNKNNYLNLDYSSIYY